MYTSAGVSTNNSIEGAEVRQCRNLCISHRWSSKWGNDNLNGSSARKAAAIHDKDSSGQ